MGINVLTDLNNIVVKENEIANSYSYTQGLQASVGYTRYNNHIFDNKTYTSLPEMTTVAK